MITRRLAGLSAIAAATLAMAAPSRAAEPITFAALVTYINQNGVADSMLDGAKLAAAVVNRAGGVLGRPLAIEAWDDGGVEASALAVVTQIIATHRAVAAIGILRSNIALLLAPYFEEAHVPLIINAATVGGVTQIFSPPEYDENYIYRVALNTSIESAMIARAAKLLAVRKLVLFIDSTKHGTSGRDTLLPALRAEHIASLPIEKFNLGDTDMSEQLIRARDAGAQMIATFGIVPELGYIARDRTAMGWNVPIVGDWTLSSPTFTAVAKAAAEGTVMPEDFFLDNPAPHAQDFVQRFDETYDVARPAVPDAAAQGYDTVLLLAAAITQAQSTDGSKIRAALDHLEAPVDGAIKTYLRPFSPSEHEALKESDAALGIIENGRIVPLPPMPPSRWTRQLPKVHQ